MRVSVLTQLNMPGSAEAWSALAFDLDGDSFLVGTVRCVAGSEVGWSFDELRSEAPLGVPTRVDPVAHGHTIHSNVVDRIDHVVYTVPDLDEAVDNLTAMLGAPPHRRFHPRGPDGPEMAFFR